MTVLAAALARVRSAIATRPRQRPFAARHATRTTRRPRAGAHAAVTRGVAAARA